MECQLVASLWYLSNWQKHWKQNEVGRMKWKLHNWVELHYKYRSFHNRHKWQCNSHCTKSEWHSLTHTWLVIKRNTASVPISSKLVGKSDELQSDGGQLTCGRYTCVGGSVAQLALAAASAALASAGKETDRRSSNVVLPLISQAFWE